MCAVSSDVAANVMCFLPVANDAPVRARYMGLRLLGRAWHQGFAKAVGRGWPGVLDRNAMPDGARFRALVDGRFDGNAVAAAFWLCFEMRLQPVLPVVSSAAAVGCSDVIDAFATGLGMDSDPETYYSWLRIPLGAGCPLQGAAAGVHLATVGRLAAVFDGSWTAAVVCGAADAAGRAGHLAVVSRLAALPFCAPGTAQVEIVVAYAMQGATRAGRATDLAALAAQFPEAVEPYLRYTMPTNTAAAGGHVAILDMLARAPFALGCPGRPCDPTAISTAARAGSVAALDRLARPPYLPRRASTLAAAVARAIEGAASSGHVAALERLSRPPYSDPGKSTGLFADVIPALILAAKNGHVAVLDLIALALIPIAPNRPAAQKALDTATAFRRACVMDRLARPVLAPDEGAVCARPC